jgi:transcriptional regulator with XRE-family HTH domain
MLKNGYQLQAARSLTGLNQAKLAQLTKLSHTTIVTLERKREATLSGSSVDTLTRIEQVLNDHGVRLVETDEGTGAIRVHT